MRLGKVNCPNCNALQGFSPKKRLVDGTIETYITCSMCKEEIVVGTETRDQVRERRDRNKAIRRRR